MKKHFARFALYVGLLMLLVAIILMMRETFFKPKATPIPVAPATLIRIP